MMKHLRFAKLLTIVSLSCAFLSACAFRTPTPAPAPTDPTATGDSPTSTVGPVVFFARDDDLWRAGLDGEGVEQLTAGGVLNWRPGQGDEWTLAFAYRPPQVSPDGRWIALSQTGLDIILIDVTTHTQERLPGPGAPIVAWAPDSRYFAYAPEPTPDRESLYLYDVQQGQVAHLLNLAILDREAGGGIRNVVWSPDGRFIAFACCFTSIQPDVYTGEFIGEIRRFEVATQQVQTVGEIRTSIASGSQLCWTADGQVTLDMEQGVRCSYMYGIKAISPDGTQYAYGTPLSPDDSGWTGSSLLTVCQAATRQVLWQREILETNVKTVAWSPDDQYLLLDDQQDGSPIWRIKADGTFGPEEILEDGFLLGVIPGWGQASP